MSVAVIFPLVAPSYVAKGAARFDRSAPHREASTLPLLGSPRQAHLQPEREPKERTGRTEPTSKGSLAS